LSGDVPWNLYQINDEIDETDGTYSPSSDDSDSDDSNLNQSSLNFYDSNNAPLSPSGLSDSDFEGEGEGESPLGSSQSSSGFFRWSNASRPRLPNGPDHPLHRLISMNQRPKGSNAMTNAYSSTLRLGRLKSCMQLMTLSADKRLLFRAERTEDVLTGIVSCNTRFEFDEEAWKCFEIPG
jgi:hypothetical protein